MAIRIYGKRLIQTPPGLATRPTSAKVRAAVFNIWQHRIQGAAWLDLCTGSGAMGAEALARGASLVVGIERDGTACRVIRDNWRSIAQANQTLNVIRGDVRSRLKSLHQTFDLIYFDPPYQAKLYEPVLSQISQFNMLEQDGAIAAEHQRDQSLPNSVANLIATKRSNYGQTAVTFYQRNVNKKER